MILVAKVPVRHQDLACLGVAQLRSLGFSVKQLTAAGFQPKQLQDGGVHLAEMMVAGYSFPEVLMAGNFPAEQVGPTVRHLFTPGGATAMARPQIKGLEDL